MNDTPAERDDYYQKAHKKEEVARLEAKEKLAYAIKSRSEQDGEEVAVWREY